MGYYDWILTDKMVETSNFTFYIFSKIKKYVLFRGKHRLRSFAFHDLSFFGGNYFLLRTASVFLTLWLNKSSKNLVNICYFKIGKTIHFSLFPFIELVSCHQLLLTTAFKEYKHYV